jgi:putative transposase
MRAAAVRGVSRRKRSMSTTTRDRDARPGPDLVQKNFAVAGPDRLWVADITYVPTGPGFLYLAVVLDAWSRWVVGWAMETHLRTKLVLAALGMAIVHRLPRAVIHHSSTRRSPAACGAAPSGSVRRWARSAMPTTTLWRELLRDGGVRVGRSRSLSDPRPRPAWPSLNSSRAGHDMRRRHSALAYESPVGFENRHVQAHREH